MVYLSPFVWIFPVIRQYKERFFYFFLTLAVFDPIGALIWLLFKFHTSPFQPLFVSYVLLITLLDHKTIKNYKYLVAIGFILCVIIPSIIGFRYLFYLGIVIIHILIVYLMIRLFAEKGISRKGINIFYLNLLLYELLNLFKFYNIFVGLENAYTYATITSIFQIAIGIFFSIFKESSPQNIIKFSNISQPY